MTSFPKIVLFTNSRTCRIYLPHPKASYNYYSSQKRYHPLKPNEPIILVKQNEENADYFYYIPLFFLLFKDEYPLTSITRWHKRYTAFPTIPKENIIELTDQSLQNLDFSNFYSLLSASQYK